MKVSGRQIRETVRLFVWFSLRHLRSHPIRAIAVLLGIALGAAVFTSVRLSVHATLDAFSSSMDRITGSSDICLVQPGGRVPDTLVAKLMRHPAVHRASPILTTYVQPAGREAPFLLIGLDPVLDRGLRDWQTTSTGKDQTADWTGLITRPYSLLIGKKLSETFGWRTNAQIRLTHPTRTATFNVLGILDSKGLALVEGGRIALCDIATFQEFTGLFGQADRIDLKLVPNPPAGTRTQLQSLLPANVVMQAPTQTRETGQGMIRAYQFSLTFLSFISLFVGMFLVYSLVALGAAARRRELAAMRATGAAKGLVFSLFMGEGALVGLIGWLLSLPINSLLVPYLLPGVSRTVSELFVHVHVDRLTLSAWEILLSFGVTLAAATLAALQPAREAMRVAPREALEVAPTSLLQPQSVRRMAVIGTGLLAIAYPVSRLPSLPAVSLPGYLAALLLFVGFSLLAPGLLRQFGRLLARRLLHRRDPSAFLAASYLRQSGVQTAVSVGALITAVALFTSLVVMIHSFRSTVALWVEQSLAGDLYIRPRLDALNHHRNLLPQKAADAVRGLPGPVARSPMRRMELRVAGHLHLFEAIDHAAYTIRNHYIWMGGDIPRIEADLIDGKGVAVSEVFSNQTGLGPGDRYVVTIAGKRLDVPILGVFRDYRTQGGIVVYSLSHYQQRFDDRSWSGVQVNFSGPDADLRKNLDHVKSMLLACCGDTLDMTEGVNLRREILQIFDETFAITTVLLLIALVVAALGIATTLVVLVLQRQVQINTIRAMGAGIGQLRRMIVWEASLIVITGQAAGLACGFILSVLLIFVVNRQSFGWTFLYRIDWSSLFWALPLIFVTALLAALPAVNLALSSSPAMLLRGGSR
ncbi:conserved uncharacterized protein, DUF214 [Desulfosarcina variabilis str. Montpellier]|uniref:ABC transporter permease n=1 Tax=Desulfosarcina variabilis TaxID=2300 RepID=UPI003AFA7C1A